MIAAGGVRLVALIAGVACLASLVSPIPTRAASILYVGPGGGPAGCAAPAYASVQAAVNDAVAGDTVHVCSAIYRLSAEITVGVDLTVAGEGASTTVLDGTNGGSPVRIINASGRTLAVSGLTLANGYAVGDGGAIRANVVTVTDSTLSGNSASGFGGGVFADDAVSIVRSSFTANNAGTGGGAVFSNTEISVSDSTFSGGSATYAGGIDTMTATVTNSTFSANAGAYGGAVNAYTATITGSTFVGNTAGYGGAVMAKTATVANSTFSGNQASNLGGGIYTNGGATTLLNDTFSGNTATTGGAISAASANLTNSVLSQAVAANNCAATVVDGGGNLSTDPTCGFTASSPQARGISMVVSHAALRLSPLADNGGPTTTIALGGGSVALDAALDGPCLAEPVDAVDQRGITRPQGAHCDSGAYEGTLPPFTDIAGSMFKSDIEWVYLEGITTGCAPALYCPEGFVTREQMASFLARSLHLSGAAPNAFTDDDTSQHHPNINLVAREKIATGCGGGKFCPTGLVSREQMASFLARALKLSGAAPNAFTDDETSIHHPNINLVAREGVATGCGNNKYCPTQNVTREQMAAFLRRAFAP